MTEYRNPRPGRPDTQYPQSSSLILTPATSHHHLTPPETIQRPCHGLRRRPDHKGQEGPAGAEDDQVSGVPQRHKDGEKGKSLYHIETETG